MVNLRVRKDLLINCSDVKLVKQIGHGGYGEVWQGTMGVIDVAVKKIKIGAPTPEILRKIEKEIGIQASLHHPNVLQIYGACKYSATEFWIVMELADGGSLYSQLAAQKDIPWNTRIKWIQEVTAAVAYLHKRGIVHRDLKSPNFLLVKNTVKVCDFGMASSLLACLDSASTYGTARWWAPESTTMQPVFDLKTDVYGMGMVMWEITSREIPFKDISNEQQLENLVQREKRRPELPRNCPKQVQQVIQQCWQHEPSERPSAETIATNLSMERMIERKSSRNTKRMLFFCALCCFILLSKDQVINEPLFLPSTVNNLGSVKYEDANVTANSNFQARIDHDSNSLCPDGKLHTNAAHCQTPSLQDFLPDFLDDLQESYVNYLTQILGAELVVFDSEQVLSKFIVYYTTVKKGSWRMKK